MYRRAVGKTLTSSIHVFSSCAFDFVPSLSCAAHWLTINDAFVGTFFFHVLDWSRVGGFQGSPARAPADLRGQGTEGSCTTQLETQRYLDESRRPRPEVVRCSLLVFDLVTVQVGAVEFRGHTQQISWSACQAS